MGIFTNIDEKTLKNFIDTHYDLGEFFRHSAIDTGTQNTNYWFRSEKGEFVFTLLEKALDAEALLSVKNFVTHLLDQKIRAPRTMKTIDGELTSSLNGKPAFVTKFIHGYSLKARNITSPYCFEIGRALAKVHVASESYPEKHIGRYHKERWPKLYNEINGISDFFKKKPQIKELLKTEIDHSLTNWPKDIKYGIIHGDLFPENALFIDNMLTGIIDFNFMNHDPYMFDLAILLLAWSFDEFNDFDQECFQSLMIGYSQEWPHWSIMEYQHLPFFLRAAALRFSLSRFRDHALGRVPVLGAQKSPFDMVDRLKFFIDKGDEIVANALTKI